MTIVVVYFWGRIVILGAVNRLAAAPLAPDGGPTPELDAALARAKQVTVLELLGLLRDLHLHDPHALRPLG